MKFYNRKEELKELAFFNKKRPSMLVITGRRRVGKTELIKRVEGAYLFVDFEKPENLLIQEFFSELKKNADINSFIKVEAWDEFLKLAFELSKTQKVTLIFDEFQRFLKINPSVIYQLQKYWDIYKDKSKIFLVFSGSSIGMIKKIFIEQNSPLFKRAQNILYIQQFDFQTINEMLVDFGIKNFEEKIKIYSIFGGIIYYYSLMDFFEAKAFGAVLNKLILRNFAPLKDEIRDIFVEEFGKEHNTYYSILSAMSAGKSTKKEIGDVVNIKETSLSPYFYDLIELLGIVEYKLPIFEKANSKRGRYFIKDSFFKFWFKFIFPNKSQYELGNFDYINKILARDFNSFVGRQFEEFCRELVENKKMDIMFTPEKAGSWWSRKGEEIDIVAVNEKENKILFAECKWAENVDAESVLNGLKNKAKYIEWNKTKRTEHYAVFAKSFKKKIKEDYVMLFDLKDIEKAFHR